MIARHNMLLATGHLSRDEIFAVVDAALEAGVRDIVITHPEFPSQDLSVEDQRRLPTTGRVARALLHHAAHRQGDLGALDREHPGHRPRDTRCSRPTSGRCSTRPWRTAWR